MWPRTAVLLGLVTAITLGGCDLADGGPGARVVATAGAGQSVASRPNLGLGAGPPTRAPSPAVAATPTPTVGPTPTPRPAPPPRAAASGYRRYTSGQFSYAIDYLEDWRATGDGAGVGAGRADIFVGERRGGLTNTVTVFVQPLPPGVTQSLFLETSLADLSAAEITVSDESERTVDGIDASVLTYRLRRESQEYAITQALFARGGQGWVITLTAAPEDEERLRPVFARMLDSLQLWG